MTKQTSVPKLRFPEFSEDWEVKKLQKICTFYSGGTPLTSKREYFNGDIPFIRSGEINSASTEQFISELGLKNSSAKIVYKGDILYALYGATSGEVGISKINGAINQAVLCIKSRENHYFIAAYLSYHKENIVKTFLQGGQGNLSAEIVKKIKLSIPPLPEQTKIANFLTAIDEKIQGLKEKKSLLEEYKKGLMQQIFSQKLRFKQDDGSGFPDWEEKTFKSVFTIGSGRDYKHLDSGNIPVFGTGGYMTSVNDCLYDGETVCIGRKGTIDKPMFFKGKLWTVDTLFYTKDFLNVLPKYIYYVFNTINWKEYNEASGVPSLSKSTIEKIQTLFPSLLEQEKIANFLSSIDEKIEKVSRQIGEAKTYKKGLLQQMFV
jgi:type I restriction enzyme, S subunit